MTVLVSTPWTDDQVESLNQFQVSGVMHPFTCGRCRDVLGTRFIRQDDGTLVNEFDLPRLPTLEETMAYIRQGRLVTNERLLVATNDGWTCPTCDYTQGWAHQAMTDWSWKQMAWLQAQDGFLRDDVEPDEKERRRQAYEDAKANAERVRRENQGRP